MHRIRLFPILMIMALLALGAAACGGSDQPQRAQPTQAAAPTEAPAMLAETPEAAAMEPTEAAMAPKEAAITPAEAAMAPTAVPARPANTPAPEFDAEGYFNGKTIRVYANHPPGGGADLNARVIARNFGDFVPGNPRVIVVSKHGAGGMIGGNYVFRAKPDGFHMGVFTGVNVPASIITPGAAFDLRPGVGMRPVAGWQMALGVWYVLDEIPYPTIWDAVGKGSDPNASMLTVNSTRECNTTTLKHRFTREALDLPVDIKVGVPSGHIQSTQALDRKDVNSVMGHTGWYDWPKIRPGWLKDGYIRPWMVQVDPSKVFNPNGELDGMPEEVPNLVEVLEKHATPEQQAVWKGISADDGPMWRSWWVPPGTPDHITAALREAAWEMLNSQQFQDDFTRIVGDVLTLNHGDYLEDEYLTDIFANLDPIVSAFQKFLPNCPVRLPE